MAQIIKHRRGGLESVKDATKRAGELLVITGSTGISAGNGSGLLFVGIDGSTVTPANKILTGSTTPTLTGGSYDTSVDGLPFYNTSSNKLFILQNTGANIEVQATANTNGTGIVSSSAQVDALGFLKVNSDGVVSGSGQLTDMTGDITVNSSGVSSIGNQKVTNAMLADDAVGADELASNAVVNASVATNAGIVSSKINYDSTGIVSQSAQVFSDIAGGDITIASNGVAAIAAGVIIDADVKSDAAIKHTKIDFDGSGLTSGSLGLVVGDGSATDTVNVGVDTLVFAGTANEIETAVTDNTVTMGIVTNPTLTGNVIVTGNLSVQGTTTTVDSTTVQIGDNILELNYGGSANTGGILIKDATGGSTVSGSFLWNATNDRWTAGKLGSEANVLLANGDSVVSGSGQLTDMTGDVTVNSSGVSSIGNQKVTNAMLADDAVGADELASNAVVNASVATNAGIASSKINYDSTGIVSGSGQIRANQTNNFNNDVKARLTAENVISSSAQIDGDFLNTNGDSVVSGSGQLTDMTGDVTVNSSGVSSIGNQKVTNAMLADDAVGADELASNAVVNASVATNAGIAFSKINSDSTGLVSGSSQVFSDIAGGDITIASNGVAAIAANSIVNADVKSDAAIDHSKIDFGGSNITSGSLNLTISGSTGNDTVGVGTDALTFAGTANEIETTVTNNQVAIGIVTNPTLTGNVTVTGNLSVEGTTTTIDSTTVNIGDRILELNYGGASGDAGILVSDAVGGNTTSGSLLWDGSEDNWMAGALGSEKELARLNATPTSNTVLKANASGLLVDSQITDDGTNVTIGGTAELRLNSATANSFAFFNGDKSLESVAGGTAGNLIQYNGSSFVSSNEIDGGTF